MKRFISALALCCSLLALLSFVLFPRVAAKDDVLEKLLSVPAPPPPNPFVKRRAATRDPAFYRSGNPPPDDAAIEDLIDFWTHHGDNYRGGLYYTPRPSERAAERLLAEMASKTELVLRLLKILPEDKRTASAVKDIYDATTGDDKDDRSMRQMLKEWLKFNSPHFTQDLERVSAQTKDTAAGYVSLNHEQNLLALTVQDFDRANPIITRMYSDRSQPVTQVLATWALYRHALRQGSPSDVDRYRRELMEAVENRSLPNGIRDKANDALASEPDFPGRDDWTISLFEDDTLVNMPQYTMLTTLFMYSPPEKYVPRMIDLLNKTSKPLVRLAAAKNLMLVLNSDLPDEMEKDVVKALLPMLEDPKWVADIGDTRGTLVQKLSEHVIPESVPGLIKVMDEKFTGPRYGANAPANAAIAMANAVNAAAYAANAASSAANAAANSAYYPSNRPAVNAVPTADLGPPVDHYPFRAPAIYALATQKDSRAVPALRRVLPVVEPYERGQVVRALFASNGFTINEQLDALELAARGEIEADIYGSNAAANAPYNYRLANTLPKTSPPTATEIRALLGQQLNIYPDMISDALARGAIDRIDAYDKRDAQMAAAMRRIVLNWGNAPITMLLLRDVKRGVADVDTILRLLSERKVLREKHLTDVSDVRTGTPSAVAIAACLIEDTNDYEAILDTGNAETKTALFACARLIRAPLNVDKTAANLTAKESLLAKAAEAYLISEDSPQARNIVLSRHPNEAMILGATTSFSDEKSQGGDYQFMSALFQSVGNDNLYDGWYGTSNDEEVARIEKTLQDEVKRDATLLGIYAYDRHYIRIYNDRVIFSWDEDDSRYRERSLNKNEFDEIKSYIASRRADELPPFLYCGGAYCESSELLMLGKGGGRRVYLAGVADEYSSAREPDFFTGLDKYFADLKKEPAKLKYVLSREIPGLDIVLARENLRAATVWGDTNGISVAASETATREKVRKAIEALSEVSEEGAEEEPEGPPVDERQYAERAKRRYEGYGWYRVSDDGSATLATQPPGVEFLPLRDGLNVPVEKEQWKARAAGFELRAGDDGLYKVVSGRLTKLLSGGYSSPVVSPDGRWAIATKFSDDHGNSIVRINLATRREYQIEIEGYGYWAAKAFVPGVNRFLIQPEYYDDHGYYEGNEEEEDARVNQVSSEALRMIDLFTGKPTPTIGEMRPFAQQTFRPLQKSVRPGFYWAALPDWETNETLVGTLDARTRAFKQVIRVPKIQFDSMQMWVDEPRKKLYFVYRGHLLSLPLAI